MLNIKIEKCKSIDGAHILLHLQRNLLDKIGFMCQYINLCTIRHHKVQFSHIKTVSDIY